MQLNVRRKSFGLFKRGKQSLLYFFKKQIEMPVTPSPLTFKRQSLDSTRKLVPQPQPPPCGYFALP